MHVYHFSLTVKLSSQILDSIIQTKMFVMRQFENLIDSLFIIFCSGRIHVPLIAARIELTLDDSCSLSTYPTTQDIYKSERN